MENDGGSVIWLEPAEAAVQLVVVIDRMGVVAGRGIDPDQGDLDGLTSSEPPLIGTGVDDQPVEPGIPALGISQVRKTAPGTDQGILDRVLRLVRISQDQAGEAEQPIARGGGEEFERLMVAVSCRLDEIALHRSLRPTARPDSPLDTT